MSESMRLQGSRFKKLALCAARAADDKKGMDISLLHIRPLTSLADYMLLVSVTSPNHMKAIDQNVRKTLKDLGVHAQHADGKTSATWRVIDYGGLLVHLMHPTAREFYALDKVYHDARRVPLNGSAKKVVRKKKSKKKPSLRRGSARKKKSKKKARRKARRD